MLEAGAALGVDRIEQVGKVLAMRTLRSPPRLMLQLDVDDPVGLSVDHLGGKGSRKRGLPAAGTTGDHPDVIAPFCGKPAMQRLVEVGQMGRALRLGFVRLAAAAPSPNWSLLGVPVAAEVVIDA